MGDNPMISACLVITVDALVAAALFARLRLNIHPHTAIRALGVYPAAQACCGPGLAIPSPMTRSSLRSRRADCDGRGHCHRHYRVDQLSAARVGQYDRFRDRPPCILAELAADYFQAWRSFVGAVRLQHHGRAELHCQRPQAFARSKRRHARPSILSTSSRTAAADGSGKSIIADPLLRSQQLADDFQCEPDALLGRQFTDLLSSTTVRRPRSKREGPSASICRRDSRSPTWSCGRRASRTCTGRFREIRSFDERARFLSFRDIGSDPTPQRDPMRESLRWRALILSSACRTAR